MEQDQNPDYGGKKGGFAVIVIFTVVVITLAILLKVFVLRID